ncbi:MAG: hypothetical protein ABI591_27190 [Kofleriaceae bacterium]
MIYGVVGVLLVGAGIIVTLFVLHRGKHKGGYGDRDTAVHQTFAALSAGDLDGLMAHAGLGLATHMITCDEGKAPTADQEAKDAEDLRHELARAIDRAKGTTYVVGELSEPTKPITKAKGESLMRGCTLDTDFTVHAVHLELAATRNGKSTNTDAKLDVAEVDGRFYVMKTPHIAGCDGAAAWTTLVIGRETEVTLANKLAAPMLAACSDDKWPAPVIECASNAVGIKDVHACLKDLDATQRAHLSTAISGVLDNSALPSGSAGSPGQARLGDQSPAAATLRAMVPIDADVPPKASDVTTEPPISTGVADFWLAPRSDGSFVITSSVVTAVFPTRPELKVAPSSRPNADGKPFDIYTISAPPYELQLIAMGRNMRDEGGFKNLEAELGKLGKVTKADRIEAGASITRFTVGTQFTLDGRLDLVHGLIVNASASGALTPAAEAFLESVHVKLPPDPVADATVLTGVRERKGLKTKMIVHDPDDHFTFEVPFHTKIERNVDTENHAVVVTIKKKNAVVTIDEVAAWDALAIGPTKLAELQAKAKPKAHLVWNAFQHRMFRITCGAEAPCDPIVKSLHFSDPEPPK